jgi:integrase
VAPAVRGSVIPHRRKDGLTTYQLRISAYGKRHLIRLGHEEEGWTPARAERERHRVAEAIKAGVWRPPEPEPRSPLEAVESGPAPTLRAVATAFLRRKQLIVDESTSKDLRWRLTHHLLPFFADMPISEIGDDAVFDYIEHKLEQRREIVAAEEAGAPLVDERGMRLRPLGNTSINMTLATLAAILDEPECQEWIARNPARGKGKRLKALRHKGNYLEIDEVKALLAAAERLDRRRGPSDEQVERAQELRAQGLKLREISDELGVGISTVHYYLYGREPARKTPLLRLGVVAVLALAGPRVSEATSLRRRDVDLHRRQLTIADSKTETGIRIVHLSPRLVEILERVFASDPRGPAEPALASAAGTFRERTNVATLLDRVVDEANRMGAQTGLPPLPENVTPHTLRRTYITLLFEARAPLPYVMAQVGHKDEKTVLGIYARVLQRQSREAVGQAMDELLD